MTQEIHSTEITSKPGTNLPVPLLFIQLVFAFMCLSFSPNIFAKDPVSEFQKAGEYYQKLNYSNAALVYEELIKSGNASPELYYNLGNCYFKNGQIAKALLNYERARKLSPDDDDIQFNIKIASLKVVDKIDAVPEIFYKRWIKSIASVYTADTWANILIGCIWILVFCLSIFLVASSASLKKAGLLLGVLFVLITTCIFSFTQKSYALNFIDQQGIVMSASVYVKSSPDEKGTDQFIIHEGTKVDVLDELGEWKKVRIMNGSVGWLKQNEIEII